MDKRFDFKLMGSSPLFKQVVEKIHRLARLDSTVLIVGETGTGKELAARAIHYLGDRASQPFVPINCGALPDSLVESELFGHERGAFTDAKLASDGLVGEAAGGTLFLDEIDTLSSKAQAALLRFIQDRTYRRVGSGVMRQVDVRLVVACNADLEKLAQARLFRQDLLYRLDVLKLIMPPLRSRGGDAVDLAETMLQRLNYQYPNKSKQFHDEAIAFMQQYSWPGNVRELENVIQREFLMCDEAELRLSETRERVLPSISPVSDHEIGAHGFREAKARAIADFERNYAKAMLNRAGGNISHAARLAKQDRSAFGKLVRKYGLTSVTHMQGFDKSLGESFNA